MGRIRIRALGASACGWLMFLPGIFAGVAGADVNHPLPNHIGIVVTTDEVFVSWQDPPGVQVARVYAYRGLTCPTGPSGGTPLGPLGPTRHLIDRTVKVGTTYCYTIFVKDSAGVLTKVGSTGQVAVPDLHAPPPAPVAASAPGPASAPAASSGGLDSVRSKAVLVAVTGLAALLLLVVLVRM